jgi:tetratricopeptide (TPR) repeat protein
MRGPDTRRDLLGAAFALLLLAGPAAADQRAKALDGLFAGLKQTADPDTGSEITQQIWRHWFRTDDEQAAQALAAGEAAMQAGGYDTALATFDRLVKIAPDFAEGWNRRATLRFLMGDYDGSVRDIERTLALEPRHFGALSGLGLIYLKLGKEEAALKAFRQALAIDPFLPDVAANIAAIEKRLEDGAI